MRLFELKSHTLTVSEEAYALKPFRDIYERDNSKDKEVAIAEIGYVYYMEDYRSDFSDILDEDDRKVEVVKSLPLPEGWEEDSLVREARRFYREKTEGLISLQYLKDAKYAINKIREFYRSVDLLATDTRGKLLFDVVKLEKVVSNSAALLRGLEALEKEVKKGLEHITTARGGKEKTVFENGA